MKRWGYLFLYFVVFFVVSLIITNNASATVSKIVAFDFIFVFIGVLLGFSITIFSHIVSMLEKIKQEIEKSKTIDEATKTKKTKTVLGIYAEFKDDIVFLFVALVLAVICSLVHPICSSIGYIKPLVIQHVRDLCQIKHSFLLTIFILCLFSIYDIIKISINLSEILIKDEYAKK